MVDDADSQSPEEGEYTPPDLDDARRLARERIEKIDHGRVCSLTPEFWSKITSLYQGQMVSDHVSMVGETMMITTSEERSLFISSQELPRCWAVKPFASAIKEYENLVNELARHLGSRSRGAGRAKAIFHKLPDSDWENNLDAADVAEIKDLVNNSLNLSEEGKVRFRKFLSSREYGSSKTLERQDWPYEATVKVGDWLAAASTRRGELAVALAATQEFERLLDRASKTTPDPDTEPFVGGENVIFYGAPGTGKSHEAATRIADLGKVPFRTIFHADLQNSDFFGSLKPQMDGDKIKYEFSPGPFMLALAESYKTPEEPVFLVIEELNRGIAAAIFGDLFQLLDRDDEGIGEYEVCFPSPEAERWLQDSTNTYHKNIRLPSNLFIYATMNSADQGVFPLDTAFRRRWRHEYLPIDYASGPDGEIVFVDQAGISHSLHWRAFAQILNNYLITRPNIGIGEDRLLGQWFVKQKDLEVEALPEKVLLYLWDDLLRHEGRDLVFNTDHIRTYGELLGCVNESRCILSDEFISTLIAGIDDDVDHDT